MKKAIFAIVLLMSTQLFAQDVQYKNSSTKHQSRNSAYGVLSSNYSRFNGQNAIYSGAYGGWMLRRKLMIGIGAYGNVTTHKGYGQNAATHKQNDFRVGYGGLMVEYALLDFNRFHITAGALAGGGIIKNGSGHGTIPENGADELKDIDASGFYVLQPSVNVEYDVTKWFRVGAGAGYRYITGSDQAGITDKRMSARTTGISLKFGGF
jgi:hypothetical protein